MAIGYEPPMTTAKSTVVSGTLVAALATVGVCDVAFGLTLQLQPLLMDALGIPAWLIGLNTAAGALGVLLAGPVLPRLIAAAGARRVAFVSIITIIVCLAAMALLPPPWWWFAFRFFMGAAIGALFTVSEAWVLTIATDQNRGRLMGIYTSMLSVTFAVGPTLLPFTGIDGLLPWIICIVFVCGGLIPLALVKVNEANENGEHGSIVNAFVRAPILFACIGAATIFDSVIISFFSIFAQRNGLPLASASAMLSAGIVSGVICFYPLGLWADRWSKNGVILICTVVTIVAALLIGSFITTPFIWPLVILIFNGAFGVYVVALAMMGDMFKGKDMVAASAGTAAMWGLGGMIGPPIAGRIIDSFGINSFPLVLAGFYTLLLLGLLSQGGRVAKAT
jgi:MFS family permease